MGLVLMFGLSLFRGDGRVAASEIDACPYSLRISASPRLCVERFCDL